MRFSGRFIFLLSPQTTAMRIGIQTWGSTGDIRPFVALAAALTQAGHQVHLVVTDIDCRDYRHYAEEYGFRITQVATPVIADAAALTKLAAAVSKPGPPPVRAA